MVNILFKRKDLEEGNTGKLIIEQIKMLAKTASPEYKYCLLRLEISVEGMK